MGSDASTLVEKLGRPGPKPKRLYARVVRLGESGRGEVPSTRELRGFDEELERVGRLVARGPLTSPEGDLLLLRARDLPEADRILRHDPFRAAPGASYQIFEWDPGAFGSGVNLEPPPALGSGRLTFLQRVSVVVRDPARALEWYRDVLGLSVRVRDEETGYLEMALGRGAAALSLVTPRPEWGEPYYSEASARVGSRTGIAFQTDSVDALELRLRHAGAIVTQAAEVQPWGGLTIRFTDPDGNEFLAFQTERRVMRTAAAEPGGAPRRTPRRKRK
ncbi:MAG: VOC family protein [Thermoplasmata archaeon]|nr:VOC family protein [Thermoplasmata archaeon]